MRRWIKKMRIIRAYKKIKNNGIGIVRQSVFISDQLGYCITEVIGILFQHENENDQIQTHQ
jgi:hypothetical protein